MLTTDQLHAKHLAKAQASLSKVKKTLLDTRYLGDILPASFDPHFELTVKFPSGKKVSLGKELSLSATLSEPAVWWPLDSDADPFAAKHAYDHNNTKQGSMIALAADSNPVVAPLSPESLPSSNSPLHKEQLYTLVMIDPDAPSRENPKEGEIRKWVVANIPGRNMDKGEILQEFSPPDPTPGTGLHRYVFLLYRQKKFVDVRTFEGRRSNWSADKWANRLGMVLEGANYFQAQEK